MEKTPENRPRKQICAGILAHVDAGKTTLSECLLFASGAIRKMGKVDTKDAFLDTDELERMRGITIFSKQARFVWKDTEVILLDTPGHVDFSAEMERTLQVLDYAVLVVSGADGVQGHTQTLWKLLEQYDVPTFLFINKMDQPGVNREALIAELKNRLDTGCVDFSRTDTPDFWEEAAMCGEEALEQYLECEQVEDSLIREMIVQRKIFPCFFGSALKYAGVEEFLDGFAGYTMQPVHLAAFGAKVYKISRDEQGNRLTHLKVTGKTLRVKDVLTGVGPGGEHWEEKVNQIRVYSGEKYETPGEVPAGCICAVTGLTKTYPGEGLGVEPESFLPVLEPVMTCQVILPEGCDAAVMLPKLRILEEEQPELHIVWDEKLQEIQAQIMGEVQTGVLQSLIKKRFGVEVTFGASHIVYKETIANTVEGVGHFEPLRHYAEVHLLLEPLPAGSGLVFDTVCSEDILNKNWQRLILTHLAEREYRGVLTGACITDMRITLAAGRAHLKHTEGGDFRQATCRALRQGLMEAESVLLEPYYDFRLEVPEQMIGRAMTDVEKMHGTVDAPVTEGGVAVLTGSAPTALMQDYQKEVTAYTKGFGRLFLSQKGFLPCHNAEEVIAASGYDPESDLANPTGSVFCAHGAGYIVPWNKVKELMHVESVLDRNPSFLEEDIRREQENREEEWLGTEEVDAILEHALYANSGKKNARRKGVVRRGKKEYVSPVTRTYRTKEKKKEYLLVDGYNIIFAWEELKELAKVNIDSARGRLADELCDYQAIRDCRLMLVFDAYRVTGHPTEIVEYHNIRIVYTKEAETADQFIEKFAHENASKYRVTVVTSDGLEQIIIRGAGCALMSAQDMKLEMDRVKKNLRADHMQSRPGEKNRPFEQPLRDIQI